jgi:hypothetical protein
MVRSDGPAGPSAQRPRQRSALASGQHAMRLPTSRPQPTEILPARPNGWWFRSFRLPAEATGPRRTRRGRGPLSSQMTLTPTTRRRRRAPQAMPGVLPSQLAETGRRRGPLARSVILLKDFPAWRFRDLRSYSLDDPIVSIISASSSWMAVSAFSSGVIAPSSDNMPPPSAAVPAVDRFAIACV